MAYYRMDGMDLARAEVAPTDFWKFSLRFYSQDEVERACLSLQEKANADVNLILLCLYAAELGYKITKAGIGILDQRIVPWREDVIKPLRLARQSAIGMKKEDPELYQDLVSAELAAEKWEQRQLASGLLSHCEGGKEDRKTMARTSLALYLIDYLGNPEEEVSEPIMQLVAAMRKG